MKEQYIDVTQEAGAALFRRNITGEVVMLNLLRFREVADYSDYPELKPEQPISGAEAFQRYIDHVLPFLRASGGDVLFFGKGGNFLIGPQDEQWDFVMLIRQKSLAVMMEYTSQPAYQAGSGHRNAALLDSRLLPLVQTNSPL